MYSSPSGHQTLPSPSFHPEIPVGLTSSQSPRTAAATLRAEAIVSPMQLIRIRRVEFALAELPIVLIPLALLWSSDTDPVRATVAVLVLWLLYQAGERGIWAISPDGKRPERLYAGRARSPAWSPPLPF